MKTPIPNWMIAAVAIVLSLTQAVAQKDTVRDFAKINLLDYLPPLQVLIDSAIANSPEIAFYDARITGFQYDINIEKKRWADDIQIFTTYNYTYGDQVPLQNLVLATTGPQSNFNILMGAGFRVPLSTVYGRNDRINRAKATRQSEVFMKEQAINLLKERIIETYNSLLLQRRLLDITAEARESAYLIKEMSEEQFRDGQLTLDQLGKSTELKAKYSTEYEQLRASFSSTYKQLERLVGVSFSKFEK